MESYSLFQLNEYIRRVIALNFREPLWIEAEISQIRESRGNYYLELIEKEEKGDDVIAQISAALWYRSYSFVKKKLGDIINDLLVDGTQVRLKCQIDYHERYGLKLVIQDIDPNYTFGKLQLLRQEIINRLDNEGLLELNKSERIPTVIQKIAIISSPKAAGYQDFIEQLVHNEYGYSFQYDLFESAVQGAKVENDTVAAIQSIKDSPVAYDIAIIIRGGGSKIDLSGYDNYKIAREIALSGVPFVLGIGHDIDQSVADLVSCLSLKTPTAVADYVVNRNMSFEANLEETVSQIQRAALNCIRVKEVEMNNIKVNLKFNAADIINQNRMSLESSFDNISFQTGSFLREKSQQLSEAALKLEAKDPYQILSQGYAYVLKEKKQIKAIGELEKNDIVDLVFSDGSKKSQVI